ncbi:hypothetical protein AAMO2058_000491700 [Amorphochlora amoebiformis]
MAAAPRSKRRATATVVVIVVSLLVRISRSPSSGNSSFILTITPVMDHTRSHPADSGAQAWIWGNTGGVRAMLDRVREVVHGLPIRSIRDRLREAGGSDHGIKPVLEDRLARLAVAGADNSSDPERAAEEEMLRLVPEMRFILESLDPPPTARERDPLTPTPNTASLSLPHSLPHLPDHPHASYLSPPAPIAHRSPSSPHQSHAYSQSQHYPQNTYAQPGYGQSQWPMYNPPFAIETRFSGHPQGYPSEAQAATRAGRGEMARPQPRVKLPPKRRGEGRLARREDEGERELGYSRRSQRRQWDERQEVDDLDGEGDSERRGDRGRYNRNDIRERAYSVFKSEQWREKGHPKSRSEWKKVNPHVIQIRAGDWECSDCKLVNFKFRSSCFKCFKRRDGSDKALGNTEYSKSPPRQRRRYASRDRRTRERYSDDGKASIHYVSVCRGMVIAAL